jgi:hypothetical protein
MTHQKYSVKFLLKKGLSYCKAVAKELGINPEGDKRQLFTWADAIVSHQDLQPVETQKQQVVIEFNDGINSCDLAGYSIIDLDGNIIRDGFCAYAAAERWAAKQFEILDQQSIAQQELVEQIETQIRTEIRTEQIVIREIDFAYSEVVRITPNGVEVLATIIHDLDTENWEVQLKGRFESFLTYAEAEAFAINYIDERGSGRILPISQAENYDIEDQRITDPLGERYTVRVRGYLAGNIWLDTNKGWTLGSDYYPEPLAAAKALALLTRKELV